MVWIVGKALDPATSSWEFQGVYDTERKAIAACTEDAFFIGPANLNCTLPTREVEWVGAWYPRLQDKPSEGQVRSAAIHQKSAVNSD